MITLIAAMDSKNGIGIDNVLPWHLPNDIRHFKYATYGSTIIMGCNTFDSIGKPLPGRRNIVMSRQEGLKIAGAEVVGSLDDLFDLLPELRTSPTETFIIGGSQIYYTFMRLATKLMITHVEGDFNAPKTFPEIYPYEWKLVSADVGRRDENNIYNHVFKQYVRMT
jgi:dihydrofolate reductase